MKTFPPVTVVLFAALSSPVHSATIVGLAEGSAIYNETGGAGGGSTATTVADPNDGVGLTMNVTFTPDATDIGQTTNAVALLEIGGNVNGTGLYLLGGELYFLSKMQSGSGNLVSSFNDLAFDSGNNMIGVQTGFTLIAGREYSVGVVYDPNGDSDLAIGVQETGGPYSEGAWTLAGAGTTNGNWAGNNTVTSFQKPGNAGASNSSGGGPFAEAGLNPLSGTAGQALMWNELGVLVPEPSTALLCGTGALLLLVRRRSA